MKGGEPAILANAFTADNMSGAIYGFGRIDKRQFYLDRLRILAFIREKSQHSGLGEIYRFSIHLPFEMLPAIQDRIVTDSNAGANIDAKILAQIFGTYGLLRYQFEDMIFASGFDFGEKRNDVVCPVPAHQRALLALIYLLWGGIGREDQKERGGDRFLKYAFVQLTIAGEVGQGDGRLLAVGDGFDK